MSIWHPSASLPAIQQRAVLYRTIRDFFFARNVLELDVPVLSEYATIDPFIDSLTTVVMGKVQYLQTSPEFFLKRFLAAYPQDVYYLGKAFRQDERGFRHRPEFTLLEWYRLGMDEQVLMDEVRQLINLFCPETTWQQMSYRELFWQHLSLDPHLATAQELKACARQYIDSTLDTDDKNPWLDLLFSHCLEPQLPSGLVGIYDYPASQAALAKTAKDHQGQSVAKRFEIYMDRMELANGYCELSDGSEQEKRFAADQSYRQQHDLPDRPYDQSVVDALTEGNFPACSGVALGVDRLLMCALQKADINDVMSF
jgi:elongation factor P--(R)-beta-lysine ligase